MSENKEKDKGTPAKKKTIKFGESECTAMRYAAMTGLNQNTKFWIQKKFSNADIRTANDWADVLLKEGAISEKPAILNQMVSVSK